MPELQTLLSPYRLLRTEADEDSSSITIATEGDFAQKPSGAVRVQQLGEVTAANSAVIIIAGGSAANKTYDWKLWGWARNNGPAEFLASGSNILGTQTVVKYPDTGLAATSKFWTDTIVVGEQAWIGDVVAIDGDGDNRVAKLCFDLYGLEWLLLEITGADGSTEPQAGDVSAYIRYL